MTRTAIEPLLQGRSTNEILRCASAPRDRRRRVPTRGGPRDRRAPDARPVAGDDVRTHATRCVFGVDVDPRGDQLQVAHALAVDWGAEFPDVFACGGFDAGGGNPPYVRQEHLGAHKLQLCCFASYRLMCSRMLAERYDVTGARPGVRELGNRSRRFLTTTTASGNERRCNTAI